ncbi:AMP-binding protein [uncultured Muribaculum sp.]|uniref:AMP-binding protein n=1 Tax=uncultured Muribaculum sp. TaxID=1918613 RepID=UPI00266F283F|nr:AMP-binding protein [uncultured Muribaculum sp.]
MINDPFNLAADFVKEWVSDKTYVEAYTSGSTGSPKLIRLKKSDMLISAKATCEIFDITCGSKLYLPLSTEYIAGKMMVVRALASGADLYVDKPSNNYCGSYCNKFDLAAIVPSQIDGFLNNTPENYCRQLIVGGGSVSVKQRDELLCRPDIKSFSTYGMTETCSHVALSAISPDLEPNVYKALPGITFSLDKRGCLIINAPAFSFRQLVTNDTAELISSTSFILTGRIDNVINSGGIKIHPEKVEAAIDAIIPYPFYITWRFSDKWGKEAVLVIENSETTAFDTSEILMKMRERLPHEQCPKEIIVLNEFKRTSSGKIVRAHL